MQPEEIPIEVRYIDSSSLFDNFCYVVMLSDLLKSLRDELVGIVWIEFNDRC